VLAPYVRGFLRAGLVWIVIGVAIGIGMAWWPAEHLAFRPAHAHANLLGFVSMFLFGVGYHASAVHGTPLSESQARWALRQVWIQNAGLGPLVGMARSPLRREPAVADRRRSAGQRVRDRDSSDRLAADRRGDWPGPRPPTPRGAYPDESAPADRP
jgi:hypothetical protein